MGLGGYLTWTAAAREIRKQLGPDIKLLPVEQLNNGLIKLINNQIFKNNDDFIDPDLGYKNNQIILPLVLNNSNANYCKKDTAEKALHRGDSHIISQICECYGIKDPDLKCVIYLSDEEKKFAKEFHKSILNNEKFITIEPFSKDNYTPNRVYPFEKWQNVVNELSQHIKIVQLGTSEKILDNVIDLTCETTFKEAVSLIQRSKLFLASESGLVHAATAVNTKSVVIITGYQDERMVAYPQNININIATHGPCGLKINCEKCRLDAQKHSFLEIIKRVKEELCL